MSERRALVIGGTGPTGPHVIRDLHQRGFSVTLLHGGHHEVGLNVPLAAHIHADPHFRETLEPALDGQTFDIVVAQYGRLRVIADVLRRRTERLIAIGSATGLYANEDDPRWGALGRPPIIPDTSDLYVDSAAAGKLRFRIAESLRILMEGHAAGDFSATYVGYPIVYGPRQPGSLEWTIVRRALDGRRPFVIADGGAKLETRLYAENAAHAVALVVDNPEIAAGKRYTVTDETPISILRRIQFVAARLNHEFEFVDMPYPLAWPCHPLWRNRRGHLLADAALIRRELGYSPPVAADVALDATIDWLLESRPPAGGELEQQAGDPFDYASEDALIEQWRRVEQELQTDWLGRQSPPAPHLYRHPKAPGENWSPPGVMSGSGG